MSKILITGGSGLVGTRLSELLLEQGYEVCHLTRKKPDKRGDIEQFVWSINNGTIDDTAFEDVEHIVHLAGAGVADKKWTKNVNRLFLTAGYKVLIFFQKK